MKSPEYFYPARLKATFAVVLCLLLTATLATAQTTTSPAVAGTKRPMTFMDVIEMRSIGTTTPGPDGKWALYTMSSSHWKSGKRFSDIYLVSLERGVETAKQLTFTRDKDESSPRWSKDGRFFVFASNRDAPASAATQNQIYLMRPDGGEARKLTEAKDGTGAYAFSRDGRWLVFSSGKSDDQQLWTLPVAGIDEATPKQLFKHATPIASWQFSDDSKRIYFLAPEAVDKDNKERKEKRFDVRVRNEDSPITHLWFYDLDAKKATRLTSGLDYGVSDVTLSKDNKWVGFRGSPVNRFTRTVTEANIYSDLYLLETATGKIERLTNNKEIGESQLRFSADSSMIGFSASDEFAYFRNTRVYLRPVAQAGGEWRKLGGDFDGGASIDIWADDGQTIYFNEGWRATNQFFALDVASGKVKQLTNEKASLSVTRDDDTKVVTISYSDPATPATVFTVASLERVADRRAWRRLTNANPQVAGLALGEVEAIEWKSSDGKMVEGIVTKPVGYEKGKRYPLIVQIHGGPAAADVLSFNAGHGYYSHIYAANGYMTLQPNYRGSANYGERHRMEIGGDYFRQGYDDIMMGVDHLIAAGLVDGDKLGVMGWSAGGHWSNWILTHTDRFKAISTGAGAVNWISMYAQSDIQRNREFYYGGTPYDNFDKYWEVSPLKYIKNAKTPTLIHVVDGDPRVPRPQSEELHMALKKLNVPTELFVYPGATHGIPDPRNQMVKMVAEFNWFEKWIKGKDGWFQWKDLLATLKDEAEEEKKPDAEKKKEGAETTKEEN